MFLGVQWKRAATVLGIGLSVALGSNATASASDDVPGSIDQAVQAALDAWSDFATTGDLSTVGMSFVREGPQFRQFEIEANAWEPEAEADPLEMEVLDLRLRKAGSTTTTVWVRVEVGRTGFVSEVRSWDVDLVKENGHWLVWTVVPVEGPPTEPARVESGPTTTVTEGSTTVERPLSAVSSPPPAQSAQVSPSADSPRGVRIPALSAWIIVLTLAGVAVAGYMAPRIDRREG